MDLFAGKRYLCVLHVHGKSEKPHWHFQGETDHPDIDGYLKKVTENHSKRIANPNCRPHKRSKSDKKPVTEDGYQYMLKESPPQVVCASVDFTPQVCNELHEKSQEHVGELKQQMYYFVLEQFTKYPIPADMECKDVHNLWRRYAGRYYRTEDKMPPPNFQKLVLWYMSKHYKEKDIIQDYIYARI